MGTLLGKIGEGAEYTTLTAELREHRVGKLRTSPRVLHLVTSFEAGGTERQFVELVKRLDRERFDVRVAALRVEGPFYEEIASAFPSVPEFRLTSFYNRTTVKQLRRLRDVLQRERIDILHTHGFYDSLFGAMAGRLARIRVIAGQRHLKLSDRRVHEWGTRAIHRFAHRIVVNSEAIRQSILARNRSHAGKIVVIRNGLYIPNSETGPDIDIGMNSLSSAKIKRQSSVEMHRELGLTAPVKLIGMVARLAAVKGHRYFLEAAARVAREDEKVHFVLVGDGPLRSEIENQAVQLGLGDRVHFLGDRKDARRLVNAFDIAVLSSLSEGLPNTVMEAMSVGVPVIATAVGGTTELIDDGVTGYLVPSANAEALAERMLFVLRNEGQSKAIAGRGREFITTQCSMRRMVESVERLYEEVLSGGLKGEIARWK